MEKLLAKKAKSGKELSDNEREAKMSVVSGLRDMAQSMMGDKLKGLKKVTVASNDEQGLKSGLEKAKSMLSDMPKDPFHESQDAESESPARAEEGAEDESHELGESEEEESSEHQPEEELSEEEINAKLEHLMKLKAKKKGQ